VESPTRERQRLGWLSRGLLVIAAVLLAGVLGLSRALVPDPRGYGTHAQFGLRPCAFATLTGRLCPTCGMTTAFAWFVRGRIDRSWRANPAGCLLAVLSIPLMIWFLACAVRAGPLGFRSLSQPLMGLLLAGCMLSLASWLIRWTVTPAALTAAGPGTPAAAEAIGR
jgi:ABC-type transport system involved in cytochrome c biogenesis permease component